MSAAGALIEMTAAVNPMDSRPHASDVGRDADSGPSLSDRYDLTGFEWCAGQHHPRVDASQNSGAYLVLEIGATIWTSRLCRVEAL